MIQGAKVDKSSLENLVRRLNSKSMFTSAVLTSVEKSSLASGSSMLNALSDIYTRFDDMFSTSNAVSVLIENNNMILSSEIKKMEVELNTLEKSIDNYSFLLADGLSYDSFFVETFSDDNNSDTENLFNGVNKLPDRSGLSFEDYQIASLAKDEGIIKITSSENIEFPLQPSMIAANCESLISESTKNSLINTVDYKNNNGWKVSVDSPVIITGSLKSYDSLYANTSLYPGAQIVLSYEMPDENPVDTLIIEPFCDIPFDVIQVKGFIDDKDEVGITLLTEPVEISSVRSIIFPKNSYKKFHLYLNQSTYIREVNNPLYSEEDSRRIKEENSRHDIDPTMSAWGRGDSNLASYKLSKLQPYWKRLFNDIKTSVGGRNSELFNQGIPNNWSLEIKSLDKKDSSISEDENGYVYQRDGLLSKTHINDSYLQGLIGRFFGSDNGSIGAFFKTPRLNTYNTGSPQMEPENQVGPKTSKRFSPYPRLGDSSQTADENIYGIAEGGRGQKIIDNGWISVPKWDMDNTDSNDKYIWIDNPKSSNVYSSTKKWLWDKYIGQSKPINGDWYWSSSEGNWVEGASDIVPSPRIFSGPENNLIDNPRVEHPWQPPHGGDYTNKIPTATTSDIRWTGNNSYSYRYMIGIKHIKAQLRSYRQKAVYISKPITVSGDLSEVKIKDSSYNFAFYDANLQPKYLTSVEYSVSNDSNIYDENNWIAILPSNSPIVYGERLFLGKDGSASFRFQAKSNGINIYRNGTLIPLTTSALDEMLVKKSDSNIISGIKISPKMFSSEDIFTCDYSPSEDKTIVSFDNYATKTNMVAPYSDDSGQGEGFYGNGKLDFYLSKNPYIDMDQVKSSTYSDTFGLSPYEPVRVVFDDMTTAINLTSYNRSQNISLDKSNDHYYYVHSGNNIIFNKPITKNFRVYYNYSPTNLRFRAILRSNTANRVTPKIDFVQIKTKTRKPDPQKD
jgi:hypothetical protein